MRAPAAETQTTPCEGRPLICNREVGCRSQAVSSALQRRTTAQTRHQQQATGGQRHGGRRHKILVAIFNGLEVGHVVILGKRPAHPCKKGLTGCNGRRIGHREIAEGQIEGPGLLLKHFPQRQMEASGLAAASQVQHIEPGPKKPLDIADLQRS